MQRQERPQVDWFGWFVPRVLLRRPARTTSLAPPATEDLEQIEELRIRGSRLELPHPVRAFVAFESERSAEHGRDALEHEGFSCRLRSAGGGAWMVTAVSSIIPSPGTITRLRERVGEVCSPLGGEYAGWEAPVVY